MKKYILGLIFAAIAPVMFAYAATPVLTATANDDNNNNVTVRVTGGEINAPVVLYFNQNLTGQGNVEQRTIGTTDANGNFTGTISTSGFGVSQNSPVYVQVGGYQSLPVNWPSGTSTTTTGGLTFSQASPSLSLGQSGTVTISGGGSGTYYIASNSNPNFTTASISGDVLTVSSLQAGQSSITVCSTTGPCAVVTPIFSGTGTATTTTSGQVTGTAGSPTLSTSNISVNQNGQGSLTISGGTTPYAVTVPAGSGISTTLVGSTLFVNANNSTGTNVVQVCSANTVGSTASTAGCTSFTVNTLGQGQSTATTPTTTTMLSVGLPLTFGETLRLSLNGGNGTFFVQSSGTSPVMANISGNILTLTGTTLGATTLNVCSPGTATVSTVCLPLALTVVQPLSGTGGGFFFDTNLSMGMTGQDVLELQNRLRDEGYFNVAPTGYYGPVTAAAVSAYQTANGLPAVGVVGPLTRSLLNQ